MVATNQIKKLRETNLLLGDQPFSLPFELFKNTRKTPKSSNPVLSAQNPWFSQVFSHFGQLLWLSCLSMHVHACRCCVVLCAALDPGESSCESPESSQNPRFSRESMWFCSGGAGFELGKFESYWYSMLEQRCRACSHRLSIQDD